MCDKALEEGREIQLQSCPMELGMKKSLQRAKISAGMWLESMSVRRGVGHTARLFILVQPRDKSVPGDKSFSSRGSKRQKSQGEMLGKSSNKESN